MIAINAVYESGRPRAFTASVIGAEEEGGGKEVMESNLYLHEVYNLVSEYLNTLSAINDGSQIRNKTACANSKEDTTH